MLEQVEEWINEESNSKYIKFQDGEQKRLAFDPTKVTLGTMPGFKGGKERRVAKFTVIDQKDPFGVEKEWTVGKQWATEIKKCMDEDHFVLDIKRTGLDLKTRYTFTPVEGS